MLSLFLFASESTVVQRNRGKREPSHPGLRAASELRLRAASLWTPTIKSRQTQETEYYSSRFCLLPAAAVANYHRLLTLNHVSLLSGSSAGRNLSIPWSCIPPRSLGTWSVLSLFQPLQAAHSPWLHIPSSAKASNV